ncbi:MAG: hypothetical protein SH821_02890 [Phototrophicales bacterium]|nr:hypothetical protein [Phototrophicales bacterium]
MSSLPNLNTLFTIRFPNGNTAKAIRAKPNEHSSFLLRTLGFTPPQPILFVSGGASGMSDYDKAQTELMMEAVLLFAQQNSITIIDGGTESGIMKMCGDIRIRHGYTFPLLGVTPRGLVSYPDHPNPNSQAELEDGHTHFVLIEGDQWGEESETIINLTMTMSGAGTMARKPAVGILINGGKIAMQEIYLATTRDKHKLPIIVLDGSGRAADEVSTAFRTGRTTQTVLRAILRGGDIQLVGTNEGADSIRQKLSIKFLGHA